MRYLWATGICSVVFGIMLVVSGRHERDLAATASRDPEEISLKDLIARGANGNPNIILKDFLPCENYVVSMRAGRWNAAWVPIVPREQLPPGQTRAARPNTIQALIFTLNARDEADLYGRCSAPRLPALVTNQLFSLGYREKPLLESSYPGTDFSRCLIIQEGREPAGKTQVMLEIGGGSLMTVAGIGLLGFLGVRWHQERRPKRRKRRVQRREDRDYEDAPRRNRPSRPADEEDDRPRPPRRRRPDREE